MGMNLARPSQPLDKLLLSGGTSPSQGGGGDCVNVAVDSIWGSKMQENASLKGLGLLEVSHGCRFSVSP